MTSRSLLHLLIFAWGLNGCSIREQAFVDGGPGKDGIPAIDTPDFNDINIADLSDSSMVLGVYVRYFGDCQDHYTNVAIIAVQWDRESLSYLYFEMA